MKLEFGMKMKGNFSWCFVLFLIGRIVLASSSLWSDMSVWILQLGRLGSREADHVLGQLLHSDETRC